MSGNVCGVFADGEGETIFSSDFPEVLLQHTLVFKVNADLSVELIEQPAAYLGLDSDLPYDPTLLYDQNAPLPPRAVTMLGSAQGK